MIIKMQCPNCGANLDVDGSRDVFFCSFCGTKIANVAEKVEITQTVINKIDRSNDPNLFISYHSTNQEVVMVSRLCYSGQRDTYVSGQSMSFHLPQGAHTIVLKIGKRNYDRNIYIPEDNTPVRINASWTGNAHISIDQPSYTLPTGEITQSAPFVAKPPKTGTRLIVWGAIISGVGLVGVFSTGPIALLLGFLPGAMMFAGGIIKKNVMRKKEEAKKNSQ